MEIFLQGLTMGLAYLAPIGAQNLFVINTALTAPLGIALVTAGIVAFFDISLALACFWGIGLVIEHSLLLQKALLGGGGLISGLAYAVKHLKPSCQVIGVQAAGAASMVDSLEAGHILTLPSVHTIADGIQVKTPGDLTFEMCRQYVDKAVAVSENEIAGAILSVLEKQKLVAEGAGAVGIAAAMYGKVDLRGKTVCALLSGGNVDVTMLERIITRGLAKAGRTANFATVLPDQPKTLATLLNIMSDMGVNVLEVNHERGNLKAPVGSCVVHLLVETRDALHVQQMYEALRAQGYPIMER